MSVGGFIDKTDIGPNEMEWMLDKRKQRMVLDVEVLVPMMIALDVDRKTWCLRIWLIKTRCMLIINTWFIQEFSR